MLPEMLQRAYQYMAAETLVAGKPDKSKRPRAEQPRGHPPAPPKRREDRSSMLLGRRMTKISTSHSSRKEYRCHDDALVISIRMANAYVKRVMIDTKSSADILYFDAFQKLGSTDKDLVTVTSTLTGFIGDFVSPTGATTIPITFGGEPRSKTLMVPFMVVKLPSAYNAIIGRLTLNRLKAIVSTYHRLLKFSTRAGVGEVRSDPRESRQCYLMATTLSKRPKVQSAATDP
ncbi:hypothetical protein BHE74_00051002 [Ensete ventricosum]|nr:hypothetical protein BHE74_00051002 [Ensete ventricosum]